MVLLTNPIPRMKALPELPQGSARPFAIAGIVTLFTASLIPVMQMVQAEAPVETPPTFEAAAILKAPLVPAPHTPSPATPSKTTDPVLIPEPTRKPSITPPPVDIAPQLPDITGTPGVSVPLIPDIDEIIDWKKLDKQPQPLVQTPPQLPPEYRQRQLTVAVEYVVGTRGQVESVRLLTEVDPALAQSIRRAVLGWRFEAGQKDGQPRRTLVRQLINFE